MVRWRCGMVRVQSASIVSCAMVYIVHKRIAYQQIDNTIVASETKVSIVKVSRWEVVR